MCLLVVLIHLHCLLRLELFFSKLQKTLFVISQVNDLKSLVFSFLGQNIDRINESKEHDHH